MDIVQRRIGNTLTFHWRVTTNGEDISFDGRALLLRVVDPNGNPRELPFTFQSGSNVADFTFEGKDQKMLGKYTFEMWENKGKENQYVVDKTNVLELVPHTEDEKG